MARREIRPSYGVPQIGLIDAWLQSAASEGHVKVLATASQTLCSQTLFNPHVVALFTFKWNQNVYFALDSCAVAFRHQPRLDRKLVCVESVSEKPAGRLRRVLTLWDLIVYGIVLISPLPPCHSSAWCSSCLADRPSPAAGRDGGHDSYRVQLWANGRTLSPRGSAYTYVGRGLNPHLGFLAGWAMLLDYLLVPSSAYFTRPSRSNA